MTRMPTRPGAAAHRFSQVPRATIERSTFDRSHGHKTAFSAGYLVPIFVDEALPGDTFNLHMSGFVRFSTLLKPIMDNMYLETFFFFVPYRLLWANWAKFNGEQVNPGDSTSFTIPQIVSTAGTGYTTASIFDYFGIPVGVPALSHSALPLRAYNQIYNQWFRDENLQGSQQTLLGDGPDLATAYTLVRRGKRHDYFTSCLPWPQKGTAVSLPLGSTAPVERTGVGAAQHEIRFQDISGTPLVGRLQGGAAAGGNTPLNIAGDVLDGVLYWNQTALQVNLAAATSASINQIREAFQIQRLLERDARGGTRYTEIIRAHFGVVSPDARLQRPEYLGGGSTPIIISPIAQTSSTDATTPQANLSGIGTGSWHGHGFVKSFTEHGIIIGLANVRADLNYQQGLERFWSRLTRYDFFWPALAHLGEQAVLNKEIYAKADANDNLVFGYQERYGDYRYKPSKITSLFRDTVTAGATSLKMWHLSQEFTALPTLSAAFIVEAPPTSKVKAVTTEVDFIADMWFKLKCARPMPVYGVPGMIDHF